MRYLQSARPRCDEVIRGGTKGPQGVKDLLRQTALGRGKDYRQSRPLGKPKGAAKGKA